MRKNAVPVFISSLKIQSNDTPFWVAAFLVLLTFCKVLKNTLASTHNTNEFDQMQ